ncbi:hypothetical protein FIU97_08190 [Roseivivax sp. THAF40]|uniref:TfoX/Sxy family DNA transformation protein n=1 Tax=unclassified Roseivivax TaxID=2639302 RepID=UPI001268272E|nr:MULTISPECIES: TfoX/Sxy family DNA transformation protein [unclassified Roseivivax]QFS82777.1 hypothetical protein FIV09_08085 [Roseivivax sp. THAF197b]QFT46546.1 hypothetical protein FIU97_08190 [Roseivivax sp. THAF40]
MSAPVSSIRGLGAAMETACARAGIDSAAALRALGGDEAYRRMVAAGTRPHFIGYYALHMALQGRPWNDLKGDEKAAFRKRFDALMAAPRADADGLPSDLSDALDAMGTRPRRSTEDRN